VKKTLSKRKLGVDVFSIHMSLTIWYKAILVFWVTNTNKLNNLQF
jgi:hypothetical protein